MKQIIMQEETQSMFWIVLINQGCTLERIDEEQDVVLGEYMAHHTVFFMRHFKSELEKRKQSSG